LHILICRQGWTPPRALILWQSKREILPSEQGFITAEAGPKGNVSISQLPPGVRLDAPWPLLKVAQQAQPHRLTYYPEARLYALTVSRQVRPGFRSGLRLKPGVGTDLRYGLGWRHLSVHLNLR